MTTPTPCDHEEHDKATAIYADGLCPLCLQRDLAAAQEALKFVERWANHHGVKPTCTAEAALSIIQHYPPILAITRSYADGKVPETRNPWAELKEAQEALKAAEELAERSTRRMVEMSEPGFIGAFAARDAAIDRAQRAEERAAACEKDSPSARSGE